MARAARGPDVEPLDIAVRAWAVRAEQEGEDERSTRPRRGGGGRRVPSSFLVFDTETTTDAQQRLLFGCWRYYRTRTLADGRIDLVWVAEGLFHPDDLGDWYPDGLATLRSFEGQALATDRGELDANPRLRVSTQTGFLKQVLWRASYQARAGVACFNFGFDVSRVARGAGETRNRTKQETTIFDGGFSLMLWPYECDGRLVQSRHRPSIAIKTIDSKRAFKGFRGPERIEDVDRQPGEAEQADPSFEFKFRGHFLDLRTLVFALTDRSHTLESACKAFGVGYEKRKVEHGVIRRDYVTYCREDVQASGDLLQAALNEFLRHPVSLQATRAYSPATIGKGYLRKMGVRPVLERQPVDPRILGWAMSAYYGGRAECRIRKTPVPVVYCDFLSMYPTVCRLMGIWDLLTAKTVEIDEDATQKVQEFLDGLTLKSCFDPQLWPQLPGIAQVIPDGDVLPVRARYSGGQSWQIGVNPLHSQQPMWFTIADLAASKLLTGNTPNLQRAIRLHPSAATAPKLRSVALLGEVPVDPKQRDFFQTVVEERKRAEATEGKDSARAKGLKVLANATSYGIYAQITRHELPAGQRDPVTVYGTRNKPHTTRTATPEDPGDYTFPPIAAAITGGARLMLAVLEQAVADAGGSYAFCDTDSMAIVATSTGGLVRCPGGAERLDRQPAIRALSERQVHAIRKRFNQLNPYQNVPGTDSILELEEENYDNPEARKRRRQLWCYAISAKRYVLYNHDRQGHYAIRGHTALDDHTTENPGDDEPALRKPSEHGLGYLLHPTDPENEDRDWIREAWEHILRTHLGLPAPEPDWLDQPAIARTAISTPRLRRQFKTLNHSKTYDQQIKPFNFLLIAFVDITERPANEQRVVLIAPFEKNPAKWLEMAWTNRYSGLQYKLATEPSHGLERDSLITPKTYRNILTDYLAHPEAKSLDPTGGPCAPQTTGLLQRRPVSVRSITHIGKEANQLEDTLTGLIADQDETLNQYDDPEQHYYRDIALPILRELGPREVARRTGHSLGAVHAALSGKSNPRSKHRANYIALANDLLSIHA